MGREANRNINKEREKIMGIMEIWMMMGSTLLLANKQIISGDIVWAS